MDNWQRATVKVRSIVWCKEVEPNPGEMAARYGAEMPCPIGASGWSAPAAAAGGSMWWRE